MTNSLVTHLQSYLRHVFEDVEWMYSKSSEMKRDYSRLVHELGERGSRVLTLDLPALGKHFDKCLAEGTYTRSNATYGRTRRGSRLPKLFGHLLLRVFDNEGKLRDSPDHNAIMALRTLYLSVKKLRLKCGDKEVRGEVTDYFAIETQIRPFSHSWEADHCDFASRDVHFMDGLASVSGSEWLPGLELQEIEAPSRASLDILQRVCDRVSSQFGDLHNEELTERPKHGPGVVSNYRRGVSKYTFRYWPTKLRAVFPYDLYAHPSLGVGYDLSGEVYEGLNHELPARLIAVPKTQKGPRLIAAEPAEHQWIQQLVWNQLRSRLKYTQVGPSISFSDQGHNQSAAKAASLTGDLATVDLSSASDRLSCWTIERMFRKNLTILERLHACRTRWLSNSIKGTPAQTIVLKKFAAMGSACTFPVQTIVYASIAISAVLSAEGSGVSSASISKAARRVSVFGDDIVIPVAALDALKGYLAYLGLKVNVNKTFGTGKFRESCGTDWYDGTLVSSPYLLSPSFTATPGSISSILEQSNNYFKAGFWRVSNWISSGLPRELLPIVGVESGISGLASFCGNSSAHLRKRVDKNLHKEYVQLLMPFSRPGVVDTQENYRLFHWLHNGVRHDLFGYSVPYETRTIDRGVSYWKRGWAPLEQISP